MSAWCYGPVCGVLTAIAIGVAVSGSTTIVEAEDKEDALSVKGKPKTPMKAAEPAQVKLCPSPALRNRIKAVAEGKMEAGSLRITVEGAQPSTVKGVGVRVFLNSPKANRETSIKDEHYAGSFTFSSSEVGPQTVFLDLTDAVKALNKAGKWQSDQTITITLVPVAVRKDTKIDEVVIPFNEVILTALGSSSPR
jgi:hypothetical protein